MGREVKYYIDAILYNVTILYVINDIIYCSWCTTYNLIFTKALEFAAPMWQHTNVHTSNYCRLYAAPCKQDDTASNSMRRSAYRCGDGSTMPLWNHPWRFHVKYPNNFHPRQSHNGYMAILQRFHNGFHDASWRMSWWRWFHDAIGEPSTMVSRWFLRKFWHPRWFHDGNTKVPRRLHDGSWKLAFLLVK